jgi:bla regulator protein blaR1
MSPAVVHGSTHSLVVLAGSAARSILLGCFVAAALTALRVKLVRTRLLAWRGVLLAALAMPLLVLVCPTVRVVVPVPSLEQSAATLAVVPHAIAPAPVTVTPAIKPDGVAALKDDSNLALASPVLPAQRAGFSWPVFAVAVYLLVALAFVLRLAIGIRFGKRLTQTATPIRDENATAVLSRLARASGLRATPLLAESRMLSVPLMMGVREPAILLPAGWRAWDADEFAAVLAHELSHVKRADALVQRLALLHRAIFWFSPLAWWLENHLAELSEQASDEAALAAGADRTRYAETLLGFFAELEAVPQRVWWHGVSMAKGDQAEKRVERILAWRNAMSSKVTKAFVVGLAICAAPVVALTASLHPSFWLLQGQEVPAPAALPAPAPPPQLAPPAAPVISSAPAPLSAIVPPLATLSVPPPPPLAVQADPPVAQAPATPATPAAPPTPPTPNSSWGNWNWNWQANGWPWGRRFVIVTPNSEPWMTSGSEEDRQHAESLRGKIPGDFIWFERDEKSYIIRDPATVDRAKKLWAPEHDLSQQQEDLRKKEEALGSQMRERFQQKTDVRVKVPDLSAQLQKLQDEVKNLSASGATMQQLGDLQRELGELQRQLSETGWETRTQWSDMGRQAGELGRQMGEIGRQMGELARQQVEKSREAAEQMQQLLDDAVASGTAKPE